MQNGEIIRMDSVDDYNRFFGLDTEHPLVSVVDLSMATKWAERARFGYGIYALFLKDVRCGNIKYGRRDYDYQAGTIVSFAPGQVVDVELDQGSRPSSHGLLFHPDLSRGTELGRAIKGYSFFSYKSNEALHLSADERITIMGCLQKIADELRRPSDRHSRRLIVANIGLLLDYCMRFYDRQFVTRTEADSDVLVRFEQILDEYFDSDIPLREGLPTVRYLADKVFLSPNYFSDMISRQTGHTASEHIRSKVIGLAKERLLSSDKTMSQIAYELGFQYPQHLSRMFKQVVGQTPNEYRKLG